MDLDSFVCPKTGVPLAHQKDALVGDGQHIEIVRFIPRFVQNDNYTAAFGLQWNTFKKTQLDSRNGTTITEKRLQEAIGFPLSELRNMRVLEAGSGAGRFTEILLKFGAKVYSFDFSNAVEANYENNMPNENLTLFQADIGAIPFTSGVFDIVICLGVLQHTPSTRTSLLELTRALKPGGMIVCDHYKYQLGMFTSLYLVYWFLIKRLSPKWQLWLTDKLTGIFFPIHWHFKDNRIAQMLLRRISPINFYYGAFDVPKELQLEFSRLDTHDRNTDHFKRHVSKRGFERLFHEMGYLAPTVFSGGTGYVARARKSLAPIPAAILPSPSS